MFICESCNQSSKLFNLIVVDKREKIYYYTVKKEKEEVQRTSKGWEIVKEKKVCKKCYEEIKNAK